MDRGRAGIRIVNILQITVAVLMVSAPVRSENTEHRLGQGVSLAAGSGFEVTYGNYGNNSDTTVVSMPLVVSANPVETVDITFELPLVYLSGRSGSGYVVTPGGGATRRRGNTNGMPASVASMSTAATVNSDAAVSYTGIGDISLNAGWTMLQEGELVPKIRPVLYLKVPTGNSSTGLGTGTFEGGPGLAVSKWLGSFQLFADASWIMQDSTASYAGKNYINYSGGGGFQATDRLFVSAFVKGSSSRAEGATAPVEARLKANFLQSRRISWEIYALAGLSSASPDAGGGLLMMYQF